MLELAILGGTVLDGTGKAPFAADLGIQGDRIVKVGRIKKGEALKEIEARGDMVAPGFIDTHSHSDLMVLNEPEILPKLMQGITTELLGQDGIGAAPIRREQAAAWRQYLSGLSGDPPIAWDWESLDEYAERIAGVVPGLNEVLLVPMGNVRLTVMGMEDEPADEGQIRAMENEIRKGLEEGAVGISLGMIYPPCTYFRRAEMVRLFRACAERGGFLVVHTRSGGDRVLEATEEIIALAEEGEVPLHISHFKVSGKRNWSKMRQALEILEKAKRGGMDIGFDIYPYTAGSTMFMAILPPWALEGGVEKMLQRLRDPQVRRKLSDQFLQPAPKDPTAPGWENHANLIGWENLMISSVSRPEHQSWVGRFVSDIAKTLQRDPAETALDILLEEEGRVGMISFLMTEENVIMGMKHPLAMICTDGLLGGNPHPRVYGTYPRILGRYVREARIMDLEEAIPKMTSLPARRLGLNDRGIIAEGKAADLVIFDPDEVLDRATYENPRQYPVGIRHVLVNGVHSVADGKFTGKRGGRVLRRK
jgi:N-acyl-D-amino-acid deacylase